MGRGGFRNRWYPPPPLGPALVDLTLDLNRSGLKFAICCRFLLVIVTICSIVIFLLIVSVVSVFFLIFYLKVVVVVF